MKQVLQWGVVGTGGIADAFAEALKKSSRCRAVNVVGTSSEKARAFRDRWELPSSSADLNELLRDPHVEAVYIASPHPSHEAQAIACIDAGKHVLCEKPITLEAATAARVIAAAERRKVFLMEAYMYRCHPLLKALIERLKAGVIGPIRHVRADFAFRVPRDPDGRLFNLKLGGGGILDVGGYPVSFSRLIAGLVEGTPFAEPIKLDAFGKMGPTGADELAIAFLTFASGFTAECTSGVSYEVGTTAVVFGETGRIVLPNPWIPAGDRQGLETSFTIHRDGKADETVAITTEMPTYAIEAELVLDSLPGQQPAWPAMTWADTLGNLRVMETWRAALRTS
ncbi:MAG TPA: Gfo/Idh/MocA family oxidoreductase [Polyangiaceae bacterium]|nr:Gfo/Idh/MocA family oxidoreductase [Polyangiaceae bacterium]